jgi:beta-galactosidase
MRVKSILFALILGCTTCSLFSQESARLRQNFNAGWLFERQSHGAGELGSFDRDTSVAGQIEPRFRGAPNPAYDDSSWQRLNLPHTWNAYDVSDELPGYWRGIGWYRKHFTLAKKFAGKRIFLEFEGANHVAEVWLNGQRLGVHKGGYTGFEFDITRQVKLIGDNVLTVKVDNLYHATIPPTVKTDYSFYGGIYRDVWLRASDPAYVGSVAWKTPSVTRESAELTLQCRLENKTVQARKLTLVHEIVDPQGKTVKSVSAAVVLPAGGTESVQKVEPISNPQLWSPATPNLYRIRTFLKEGTTIVDNVENPLGFRWFRFDPQKGFFLNGERVQIQGVNWHQSYPGMGNALPNSRHVMDMEMIKEMGGNFWRTSHYPHDIATIEASDRLGLIVWEELPINKEIGEPNEYIANAENMAREMIGRDHNHPSIVMWGFAGEVDAPAAVAYRAVKTISELYRKLDPSRLVVMHAPRGEQIEALVDVSGLGVSPQVDKQHERNPNQAIMVGEYSAATMGRGIYGNGPNSEERALAGHERYLSQLNLRPWMAGGCIWNMFDYDGETYDVAIPHVVAFGMTDIWRIPKEVFYFYQSQWNPKPMVHIVGHWTWPGEEGKIRQVKVYSNASMVELFLNGKSLGIKERGAVPGLANPPRIWQVAYEPGSLKAVARAGGQEITDERKTAGPPRQILLSSSAKTLISGDPESLAYITATIADESGTPVPGASNEVTFTLYGPGELLPQEWLGHGVGLTWNVVDARTVVAMRATPRTGNATLSAYSPGLKMGRTRLSVAAPGKKDEMEYLFFDADESKH